jgi:hypothetical protein
MITLPNSIKQLVFVLKTQLVYNYKAGTDFSYYLDELWASQAVPWLRWLVAGLSPRSPRFDLGPDYVRFAVDKGALGQIFSESFIFH